ncbi:LysR family transcriptional regulator [Cocleimonas sp. KMM 6892]|uniref:LysR family transcriptional regulator n=1 Tax=unclassified Cocleimonas TaxID=2639732 RepID=UPI002DBFAFA8|nr:MULTISPECIES: LysR family transcriptional regulator [unclassified Cocleimonas]MEB8431480.1 LysR family transcriptional regulator [Cocleimonas sp. KMM 6892]MEC4713748.1 LysR family transcriptional regulator [Cocleimonas sp. KMM 6895]MEC4743079.1 LysR family transcriptional regulator [Cocleimonas sp. KMM 6896]
MYFIILVFGTMINYLRHMSVFASVVDEGSFRAAAKTLGIAPSRVSETVSDLEQYLNVTLMHRTTRKLFLTNEGKKFYAYAAEITRNAEAGLNELNVLSQESIGSLKIALPAFLASSTISTAIAEFARQHPKVSLTLTYSDQVMDILEEGLDLSIRVVRVGLLEDSSMMSRKLGESGRLLVAGKKYAEGRQIPKHPSDLKDWDWLRFQSRPSAIELISTTGESVTIQENASISLNSSEALKHFTLQNLGVTILPVHLVVDLIASGELVHVLPEWKLRPLGYYAVWPDKSRRENLTLLLVRFLAKEVKGHPL